MRNLEMVIIIGMVFAWVGFGIYLASELATVRPNVERIVLDLNGVSK
jgi:hypothetical protein